MPRDSRIHTVVLTVAYSTHASYYLDWQDAFAASPWFAATTFNLFHGSGRRAARQAIATAELVVALHPCSADTLDYLRPLASALQARRGRFLMFVGNEYNLPWIRQGDKRDFVRAVGADWVATQLPIECGRWLYEDTGARVIAMPHALNETVFRRETPDADRTIDIGGRSARYPVYLGDDERNRIYDAVARLAPQLGLHADIDRGTRFDRPGWAAFLDNCRGTIGSEAGTWYLERDDHTALAIRDFLNARAGRHRLRADGAAHRTLRRLPYPIKEALKRALRIVPLRHEAFDDDVVDATEIQARFFAGRARCPAYSKCVSSRHFDAAGTGTCQLLVRGRYNDIFAADHHYIAVDHDLGNLGEAVARFRDVGERRRIADAAYELTHESHTYRHRLSALRDLLAAG